MLRKPFTATCDAGAEEFVARDDARMPIGAALEFVRQFQQDIVPLLR